MGVPGLYMDAGEGMGELPMNDRGLGFIELIVIVVIIGTVTALCLRAVRAEPVSMHLTCYCPESCPGTTTYTGAHVREGIAAVTEEHIGDCAMLYTVSGDFIGYYECLDKIGTGRRTVIDVWQPNLDRAKAMMALTRGRVLVEWVENPGG